MVIKKWIDEIKTDESDQKSEAQNGQLCSTPAESFPGENRADEILFAALDRIIECGVFYGNPETRAAEIDVDRFYKAIINGGNDFAALRAACTCWIEAAQKAPSPAETISLFSGSGK